MQLTYKYTLRPSKYQAVMITTHLELCRRQYNYGLGERFKCWESTRTPINAFPLYAILKPTEAYHALSAKVSNQVIKQVIHDWSAWKEATLAYLEDSSQFQRAPQIPKYKHKTCDRNLLV